MLNLTDVPAHSCVFTLEAADLIDFILWICVKVCDVWPSHTLT